MDRESFPQLVKSATGWPIMHVPWGTTGHASVEVSEHNDEPSRPVYNIVTSAQTVTVLVNGMPWKEA
jgi:hypothetical protein